MSLSNCLKLPVFELKIATSKLDQNLPEPREVQKSVTP